mgnify:CR=1 FL=1
MARAQEEAGALTTTAEAGGGVVRVTANGHMQLVKITLSKEVVEAGDTEMLEDLVLAAANRALADAKEMADAKMATLAQSILPPGFPSMM